MSCFFPKTHQHEALPEAGWRLQGALAHPGSQHLPALCQQSFQWSVNGGMKEIISISTRSDRREGLQDFQLTGVYGSRCLDTGERDKPELSLGAKLSASTTLLQDTEAPRCGAGRKTCSEGIARGVGLYKLSFALRYLFNKCVARCWCLGRQKFPLHVRQEQMRSAKPWNYGENL